MGDAFVGHELGPNESDCGAGDPREGEGEPVHGIEKKVCAAEVPGICAPALLEGLVCCVSANSVRPLHTQCFRTIRRTSYQKQGSHC